MAVGNDGGSRGGCKGREGGFPELLWLVATSVSEWILTIQSETTDDTDSHGFSEK